eukprot:1594392-Amphidinium_carterae.1
MIFAGFRPFHMLAHGRLAGTYCEPPICKWYFHLNHYILDKPRVQLPTRFGQKWLQHKVWTKMSATYGYGFPKTFNLKL